MQVAVFLFVCLMGLDLLSTLAGLATEIVVEGNPLWPTGLLAPIKVLGTVVVLAAAWVVWRHFMGLRKPLRFLFWGMNVAMALVVINNLCVSAYLC